ncbi:MAG: homoserine dehydrogenase [Anaerolineales bacterium]|nr:homoserine dehydrogenase [Anaerolineales bacterium]
MAEYKLAFLGFGNVGQALAELLLRKQADLQREGITFITTGIATGRHGAAIDPLGIDLKQAVALMKSGGKLDALSAQPAPADAFAFLRLCGADVLFENTPVNYETGQPAIDHLRTALALGMHALTANKGPVVHAHRLLTELAASKGRCFFHESTVMDGAPIFSLFREALPAARLHQLRGVLNSTSNLILTRMEDGESFEQAVAYAQSIGIAETDPSGDIDGWDAAVKVAALATVLMEAPIRPQQVERKGIRQITLEEIARAQAQGKRWKLVCAAWREGEQVQARVGPEMVGADSPLYQVDGTTSIIEFETDVLGKLSLVETDPGPHTTAYGLLADFINAVKRGDGR